MLMFASANMQGRIGDLIIIQFYPQSGEFEYLYSFGLNASYSVVTMDTTIINVSLW